MTHMTIMRGGPGSGKSWYVAQRCFTTGVIPTVCSADEFFINDEGAYDFDPKWLGRAHGACLKKCVEAMTARREVIIDNTNSKPQEMIPYLALCQAFGYTCKVVRVLCDPEIAWARQTHDAPRETFDNIHTTVAQEKVPSLYRGAPWLTIEDEGEVPKRRRHSLRVPIYQPHSGAVCSTCGSIIVYGDPNDTEPGHSLRYCDHEADTCECQDGKETPGEPFPGLDPRSVRLPDGLADCRTCGGKIATRKNCRMTESNLDSCTCGDEFVPTNFRKICNCGVAMGIRGDHEGQCAAAYIQRS